MENEDEEEKKMLYSDADWQWNEYLLQFCIYVKAVGGKKHGRMPEPVFGYLAFGGQNTHTAFGPLLL